MDKRTIRKAISYVFSFLISMLLFLLLILIMVKATVFNQGYALDHMATSGYYQNLSEEIEQEYVSLGAASGFPESFFKGIVDRKTLAEQVSGSVKQLYTNTVAEPDYSAIEQELREKFAAYAEEQGHVQSKELSEGIEYLTSQCMDIYKSYATVPYAGSISPLIQKITPLLLYMILGVAAVVIVLAGIVFAIHPTRRRALPYYIYALCGTFLMTIIIPVVALISNRISHIAIATEALYQFAVSYLTGIFYHLICTSLAAAALGGLIALIYTQLRKAAHQ